MTQLPERDFGFQLVDTGNCSITLVNEGRFVRTPWVVPQQPLGGQPFQLHASVVAQMAQVLGLAPVEHYQELLDQRDARIEELEGVIGDLKDEMSALRYAAERYWASEVATTSQQRRSKNEERIEALNNTVHDQREQIAKLKQQMKKENITA